MRLPLPGICTTCHLPRFLVQRDTDDGAAADLLLGGFVCQGVAYGFQAVTGEDDLLAGLQNAPVSSDRCQ